MMKFHRVVWSMVVILLGGILLGACNSVPIGELASAPGLAAAPTLAPTARPVSLLAATLLASPTILPPTYTPSPTQPPTATPALTPTLTITPTFTPSLTPTIEPTLIPPTAGPLRLFPGRPQGYLTRYRLVAFYGVPATAALGALGLQPVETMIQQLRGVAEQYQALGNDRTVLPTFHMITTIADPFPGDFGNYSHWIREDTIAEWVELAGDLGMAMVLDIQPGYADLMFEVQRLERFLYEPHVHLALDPEFIMHDGAVPGSKIGYIEGPQINPVQAFLEEIALETGLNKVLIVHQFDPTMVYDKEAIEDYPHVELVMDADGFGSPEAKIGDYVRHAGEPGFEYGGFKLFYNWDVPLMAPAEVMNLEPRPAVIIYQ